MFHLKASGGWFCCFSLTSKVKLIGFPYGIFNKNPSLSHWLYKEFRCPESSSVVYRMGLIIPNLNCLKADCLVLSLLLTFQLWSTAEASLRIIHLILWRCLLAPLTRDILLSNKKLSGNEVRYWIPTYSHYLIAYRHPGSALDYYNLFSPSQIHCIRCRCN